MFRFNKLGLDKISVGEEPTPSSQVEEVHSYTPVRSAPLNSEKIVYIDIGTAHSVAVTGKEFPTIILWNYIFEADCFLPVNLCVVAYTMVQNRRGSLFGLALAKLAFCCRSLRQQRSKQRILHLFCHRLTFLILHTCHSLLCKNFFLTLLHLITPEGN